jgi:hypothetical protein
MEALKDVAAGLQSFRVDILLERHKGIANMYFLNNIVMLKAFDNIDMSKCKYIKNKYTIITASRGRSIKFWEIPKFWRDVST